MISGRPIELFDTLADGDPSGDPATHAILAVGTAIWEEMVKAREDMTIIDERKEELVNAARTDRLIAAMELENSRLNGT